ncbi:hypothetical protein TNCV_4956841 [Trichonephila clavipes]|nr:hypothetical protein TNCV_4956841 [Trichonephila clavipes]
MILREGCFSSQLLQLLYTPEELGSHQSLPPTNLGPVEEQMVPPGTNSPELKCRIAHLIGSVCFCAFLEVDKPANCGSRVDFVTVKEKSYRSTRLKSAPRTGGAAQGAEMRKRRDVLNKQWLVGLCRKIIQAGATKAH